MTTVKPRTKRRTYLEVETASYAKGWAEGREQARKDFEDAYNLLSRHDTAVTLELIQTEKNLRLTQASWTRALRGRITSLFSSPKDY